MPTIELHGLFGSRATALKGEIVDMLERLGFDKDVTVSTCLAEVRNCLGQGRSVIRIFDTEEERIKAIIEGLRCSGVRTDIEVCVLTEFVSSCAISS